MSPSCNIVSPGIPCTTSLLIEAHILPGKPPYPLKEGSALYFLIFSSAILSNSKVDIPGEIAFLKTSWVSATILPASLKSSISFLISR